ncbi:helix-hairpin-helix domain-containing protein [Streptococcus sp. DD13]|uniref:helix-hairpin-helix domain-containing protein n=1 Tax=Streptococcus sp. DD13 TaxID=1777881 RepID=UPI00079CC5F0|nr:helix-hairpin-helix domain-containing protein [Streptococcus sp. DD13]KXT78399.1 Late competence protein ComEA, DNA receptor [Streptococcus sp. DD13]
MEQIMSFYKKNRTSCWVGGGLLILGLIVLVILLGTGSQKQAESLDQVLTAETTQIASSSQTEQEAETELASTRIQVDVKGAVQSPGLYELSADSRVNDAIQLAGGFTQQADIKSVNLAQKLTDEGVVYVATKEEGISALPSPNAASSDQISSSKEERVNINTATAEELQTLTGVGQKKASDIIAYREENGPFQSIEDLSKVSGIGQKTIEKWKDHVTVGS